MKQGEIWLIDLEPTVGAEMKKIRPAVIINDDALGRLPLKIIVPLTDWKEHYSMATWMIPITPSAQNGLTYFVSHPFQSRSTFVRSIQ